MSDSEEYKAQLLEYRRLLIQAEQKAQETYDKTVLALSGGAFGISFAFVENFVSSPQRAGWLLGAWVVWGLSITAVLFSFYFSTKALRKSVIQVDDGEVPRSPGGRYSGITSVLNALGGVFFFVGALLLVIFVALNT
jgi:hypothetical protein